MRAVTPSTGVVRGAPHGGHRSLSSTASARLKDSAPSSVPKPTIESAPARAPSSAAPCLRRPPAGRGNGRRRRGPRAGWAGRRTGTSRGWPGSPGRPRAARKRTAAAHVGDARLGRGDERAAGSSELQQHDRGEDLGHGHDAVADQAGRRRVAMSGIGMTMIGTPRGRAPARLGHVGVVLQRRDGAVDRREDRPLLERGAGHGLEHVDQRGHELGAADLVLQVLAALRQREVLDLEVGRQRVEVAGRQRRPHVVALGRASSTRMTCAGASAVPGRRSPVASSSR